jgi:hypothetical protein
MLDLIIQLLLALGLNFYEDNIRVIDTTTGATYGVGNQTGVGNSLTPNDPQDPVIIYELRSDSNGNYYLVRR